MDSELTQQCARIFDRVLHALPYSSTSPAKPIHASRWFNNALQTHTSVFMLNMYMKCFQTASMWCASVEVRCRQTYRHKRVGQKRLDSGWQPYHLLWNCICKYICMDVSRDRARERERYREVTVISGSRMMMRCVSNRVFIRLDVTF